MNTGTPSITNGGRKPIVVSGSQGGKVVLPLALGLASANQWFLMSPGQSWMVDQLLVGSGLEATGAGVRAVTVGAKGEKALEWQEGL
jgi:hypothetical protein